MGTTFVVIGLRRKYAELKGRIRYTSDCWNDDILDALRQVGNVLRMFNPDENLSAIEPVRPYKPLRGRRWTRTALDVLRAANEPLTGREIAKRVAAVHGVTDRAMLASIEASLHATLSKREGVAMTQSKPKKWSVGA
jgi:hypothetical protein